MPQDVRSPATNGDFWTTLFSGETGKTTLPITRQTLFTLQCISLPGANPPTITAHVTVNIIPTFQEI